MTVVQPLVFRFATDGVLVAPPHCGLLAVPDFLHHVESWCATDGPTRLVVDLSEVDVLEAPALRSLLWARHYCASHGRSLAVRAPADGVLRPLEKAILHDLYAAEPAAV